jgi:hypothetical protein
MMLFYFLAGVKNSEYYSSPSYFEKVSRLVYEFGLPNKHMLADWFSAALQTSLKCGR